MNHNPSLPCHAVVLDLDGTLVDTLGDFHAVLALCLLDMRLPPLEPDAVRTLVGKGSEHLIRSVLTLRVPNWNGLPTPSKERFFKTAWSRYLHHYALINGQHSQVFAGVREGLHALSAMHLPLACLTNKPLAFAIPLLERMGLEKHFLHVFGGDSFAHKKPHPMPLLKTCEALGTAPAHTWMVGDSSNDALAARAAGCPVALVTYGYNHGQPIELSPHDLLLDSLANLLN
jgi:phosphoglycolate phosphatase